MAVQLVEEAREEQPAPEVTRSPYSNLKFMMDPEPEAPAERVIIKRVVPDKEIITAMSAIASVLAVRMMLLLAVVGAFILALQAMHKPDFAGILLVGVYAAMVVLPLCWLSVKRP